MWEKTLNKDSYSEWVIRNALYWFSTEAEWTLDEGIDTWIIRVTSPENTVSILDRYINDFKLREQVSLRTHEVRNQIVEKVLGQLSDRLSR